MLTSGCAFDGISVPAVISVAIGALDAVHGLESSEERPQRESVLFIGTQFSNLYTAVDTPATALLNGWDFVAPVCNCPPSCDFVALPVSVSMEV